MEEMKRGDSSDESMDSDGVDDENVNQQDKKKKSAYRRRGRNKDKYICKFSACGQKVKVDHCLCARLILAGSLSIIIIGMFYCISSIDASLKE